MNTAGMMGKLERESGVSRALGGYYVHIEPTGYPKEGISQWTEYLLVSLGEESEWNMGMGWWSRRMDLVTMNQRSCSRISCVLTVLCVTLLCFLLFFSLVCVA